MRSIECSSRSTHIFTSCLPIIVCINMFLCAYKENILCHTTSALPLIDEKATDTACATSETSTAKTSGNACMLHGFGHNTLGAIPYTAWWVDQKYIHGA
jgi:hypothetical protein